MKNLHHICIDRNPTRMLMIGWMVSEEEEVVVNVVTLAEEVVLYSLVGG